MFPYKEYPLWLPKYLGNSNDWRYQEELMEIKAAISNTKAVISNIKKNINETNNIIGLKYLDTPLPTANNNKIQII